MTKIDPQAARERLTTETLGQSVFYYEQTCSTNADAKELGRAGAPHGTLVLCARQTAGRGRRGRSWLSEENAVCMTAVLRPAFPMELAPRYVIALAVGVCRALRSFGANALIKWPNDIMVADKKICGILLEADASGFVAAGIGVNVNQTDFPEDIAATATSLAAETGKQADPNEVIAAILNACEPLLDTCASAEGYATLLGIYQTLSKTIGSRVRVFAPGAEYTGVAIGLDSLGMLIVKKDSGETVTVSAGDVTIRGANND